MCLRNEVFCILIFSLSCGNFIDGILRGSCKFNEFRCSDGTCILSEKLCNGIEDCVPDGEDETGSDQWDCSRLTLGTSSQCGDLRKYFRCRYGGCIDRNLVCDDEVHCFGGSDEAIDLCRLGGLKPVPGFPSQSVSRPSNGHTKPSIPLPQRPRPQKPPPPTQHVETVHSKPSTQVQRPQHPRPVPAQPPPKPFVPDPPPPRPTPTRPVQTIQPNPVNNLGCPIDNLETEEGEEILCKSGSKAVHCKQLGDTVSNGTVVFYRCKKHYAPPNSGPTTTRRFCLNGRWTSKRRWFCDLQCGIGGRDIISFIVNGTQSTLGKWPWHVGLYEQNPPGSGNYVNYCGGTLLSPRRVLTAAHCVTKKDTRDTRNDEILLGFGKYYRSIHNNDEYVRFRKIAQIDISEYYDPQQLGSDIALIWLNESLDLSDRILPACLPFSTQESQVDAGDIGTLAGWGRYTDKGYPEEMQEARLPIVTQRVCQEAHPSLEGLVKSQSFCAGYRNGTSACEGDSGGGLVFEYKGKWSVHGVVSAGVSKHTGGCDARYYTVFTRITKFKDWFDKVLDAKNINSKKR